jgi:formylglycine-generating enzyme required for sulfatase activity
VSVLVFVVAGMSHRIVVVYRDPETMRWTGRPVEQPNPLIITEPIRLALVRVPAGEFLMGSHPAVDREAARGELPQQRVTLAASPSLPA